MHRLPAPKLSSPSVVVTVTSTSPDVDREIVSFDEASQQQRQLQDTLDSFARHKIPVNYVANAQPAGISEVAAKTHAFVPQIRLQDDRREAAQLRGFRTQLLRETVNSQPQMIQTSVDLLTDEMLRILVQRDVQIVSGQETHVAPPTEALLTLRHGLWQLRPTVVFRASRWGGQSLSSRRVIRLLRRSVSQGTLGHLTVNLSAPDARRPHRQQDLDHLAERLATAVQSDELPVISVVQLAERVAAGPTRKSATSLLRAA